MADTSYPPLDRRVVMRSTVEGQFGPNGPKAGTVGIVFDQVIDPDDGELWEWVTVKGQSQCPPYLCHTTWLDDAVRGSSS